MESLGDIFAFQVRISFEYFVDSGPVGDLRDDHRHGYPHATNAGTAAHDLGIESDAVEHAVIRGYDCGMSKTLGIITVGQAPRDDIAMLFASHAPPGTKVVLRGALDGLVDAEVDALEPESGADTLYTRLRGGRDVKISKKAVIARSPATLARLRDDGCDVLVYACTGDFPPMAGDGGVLFPSRVLNGLATGLLPRGRLGLLIPLAEQAVKLGAKWARPGLDVFAEALAPSAGETEARAAAGRLAAQKPDLVAMDCMSYSPATKAWVKPALGVPTLLAISATGRVLREMLD